jgi:hypothetical protein
MDIDLSNIEIKELAGFICALLSAHGIEAVLVGGGCVSIYSKNRYQSFDIDFVSYDDLKSIAKVLQQYHFKRSGRCFSHDRCPYLIDFVNPPVAIGQEPIQIFETLNTMSGSLRLLTPTDCVKDRLASFFDWNDEQALEQALLVAQDCSIDIQNIKHWAKAEGFQEKFKLFLKKIQALKDV